MITLTNPIRLPSQLGGPGTIGYNKLIVFSITVQPKTDEVSARIELSVSTDSSQPVLVGNLNIVAGGTAFLEVRVSEINFRRRLSLNGPQANGVVSNIDSLQDGIENFLISLGVVGGIQSPGI